MKRSVVFIFLFIFTLLPSDDEGSAFSVYNQDALVPEEEHFMYNGRMMASEKIERIIQQQNRDTEDHIDDAKLRELAPRHLLNENNLIEACNELDANGAKVFSHIKGLQIQSIIKLRDFLMTARYLAVSKELFNLAAEDNVFIVNYDIWALVQEKGIDPAEDGGEELLRKLLFAERCKNEIKRICDTAPIWELELENPMVAFYMNFLKKESEEGDQRLRKVYKAFYELSLRDLYNAIDKVYATGFFRTMKEDGLNSIKEKNLKRLCEHAFFLVPIAQTMTRDQIILKYPWVNKLYTSFYNWLKKYNPDYLMLRQESGKEQKCFKMAPTFYESPVLVKCANEVENKEHKTKEKDSFSREEKVQKKHQEEEELQKLLAFLGEDSGGKKKSNKKKKSAKHDSQKLEIQQEEIPVVVASAAAVDDVVENDAQEETLFSRHLTLPIVNAKRVAAWFKNPQNALQLQGYFDDNNFRKKLLDQHGRDKIIENHKFPVVIDQHLMHSKKVTIIEQSDGSFKVALPGYRKKQNPDGSFSKEFGIFEVAYTVEKNGTRKVFHRFFRPVQDYKVLVNEFGISHNTDKQIDIVEGVITKGNDESWTTAREQEGWGFDEVASGFYTVTRPDDTTSYGVFELQ